MGVNDETRRIDAKGRVTIPRSIRESLSLESGETVEIAIEAGRVVIRPQVSRESFIEAMEGCIDADSRAPDAEPEDPRDLKADWTSDLP